MSFLTINLSRRCDRQRLILVVAVLVLATSILVYPSVPALLRILPDSCEAGGLPWDSYVWNLVVYFVLTLLVLSGLRPERGAHDVTAVTTLLVHGILTELIPQWQQLGAADIFAMTCNFSAVLAAASLYIGWSCRTNLVDRNRRTRWPSEKQPSGKRVSRRVSSTSLTSLER